MPKRKKKKQMDARGYSTTTATAATTSSQPARSKQQPSTVATTSTTSSNHNASVPSTRSTLQLLDDLVQLLDIKKQVSPAPMSHPPSFYSKRMGALYDALSQFHFTVPQMELAVRQLGVGSLQLQNTLNHLCLWEATADLPPRFTEGLLRDAPTNHTKVDGSLTVVVAASTATTPSNERPVQDTRLWVPPTVATRTDDDDDDDQKQQQQQQHKEWLLSRYQYESEEEEEEEEHQTHRKLQSPDATISAAAQEDTTPNTADTKDTGDAAATENATPRDASSNNNDDDSHSTTMAVLKADTAVAKQEEQLQQLQTELSQLQLENTEANNYMRSKGEIKVLHNRIKVLRQKVKGLQGKLQKRQKEQADKAATKEPNNEQVEGAPFDIFAAQPTGDRPLSTSNDQNPPPNTLVLPKDTIPNSWTGATPRQLLEQYCQGKRLPKPVYKKLPRNGCRVRLNTKMEKSVPEGSIVAEYRDAVQYASVLMLYQLNPTAPLYRLFPVFYRDLWLGWQSAEQAKLDAVDAVAQQEREQIIDRLLACLPTCSTSKVKEKGVTDTVHELEALTIADDEWDRPTEVQRSLPPLTPTGLGNKLRNEFLERQQSGAYRKMADDRKTLPIHGHRQEILDSIQNNAVTILQAETGSGKTTQCSSFVLEEALCNGYGDKVSILCTQPRRVAATSVAERVAEELAESGVGNLVGYQIRMETKKSSRTRLLFCTTGVVLRRLVDDPTLKGITHVVVDEVHERQWQIDLLLVTLRSLLSGKRPDLKVVVMSATLDERMFSNFFNGAPVLNIPGRTFPVSSFYLEDILEETGHLVEEGSRVAKRDWSKRETVSLMVTNQGGTKRRETADYQLNEDLSDDFSGYSVATRRSLDRVDETVINFDLIEDVLLSLFEATSGSFVPPDGEVTRSNGAVLVFLPGIREIRTLVERLAGSRFFGNRSRFEVVPMHSSLSTNDHRRAFRPSQPGVRKIIISTNIAETSVTLPDVVYVIDSGRVREIQRDKRTSTRKLVATWCSRASTKQRAGRAGRVQPGVCLKLFTSKTESNTMKESTEPELRRMPLEEVCLSILAGGLSARCGDILSQTPEPPSDDAVCSALQVLEQIGALEIETANDDAGNRHEALTGLGLHLAKLPVHPRVGKMIIFGSLFNCVDATVTIAACLSASKSPFDTSTRDSQQAKASQATFIHAFSDFFTLLNMWDAFEKARLAGKARQFCKEKFLRFTVLNEIRDARLHFFELLCGLGFLDSTFLIYNSRNIDESSLAKSAHCRNSKNESVVHSIVAAGLYPNIAHFDKAGQKDPLIVYHRNEKLHVHSSVNSKITTLPPSNWMTFFEKFGTERRVSISQTTFVSPVCLLLFGSNIEVLHARREAIIDGWIMLSVAAKTAVLFREIRNHLHQLLTKLVENSTATGTSSPKSKETDLVIEKIVQLLATK